jgi:hypothetical protein
MIYCIDGVDGVDGVGIISWCGLGEQDQFQGINYLEYCHD